MGEPGLIDPGSQEVSPCGGIMVLVVLRVPPEFLHEQGLGLKNCDLIGKG